jgi:hypothetical protein
VTNEKGFEAEKTCLYYVVVQSSLEDVFHVSFLR